jgi:hypothetical protein
MAVSRSTARSSSHMVLPLAVTAGGVATSTSSLIHTSQHSHLSLRECEELQAAKAWAPGSTGVPVRQLSCGYP